MSHIENAQVDEYNETIDTINTYTIRRTIDLLLLFGYILFSIVALFALIKTHNDSILFIRNILFLIGFLGIATEYYFKYKSENTIALSHVITDNRFIFYNTCMVLYGIVSILYKNSKYHMNVFYRKMVEKPTIFGLEIDALLVFISHCLLIVTKFIRNTYSYNIMYIIDAIFIGSYAMSFIYNINTPIVKNKLLYYIITI
jgi:hypothetical protein